MNVFIKKFFLTAVLALLFLIPISVKAETKPEEDIQKILTEAEQNGDDSVIQAYRELNEINENQDEPESEEVLAKVLEDYAGLKNVVDSNPDYFGIMVPFFTDKDTEETPVGAILALTEKDPDQVSLEEVDQIILGLTQSLNAYIEYYGADLLAVRDKALSRLDDNMSDLEKCLVLHDFINDLCNFDLADANYMDTGEQDTFIYSTPFGSLVRKSAVCIGYASGYAYLVQNAFPEIYKNEDGTWKTREEVKDTYIIDFAKAYIPSIHYFNVLKLDGQWYYVDPSFDDIAVQDRQYVRLETSGNLRHQMFLITHESMIKWQNLKESDVDSAYRELCNDDRYESAWFHRIQSYIYYDDENWYFVRGKVDTRKKSGNRYIDREDQIIARNRTTGDEQILVDLDTSAVNTVTGESKGTNELLSKERQKDLIYNKIYPGLQHCIGMYDHDLYFNVSNKIFKYQIQDGGIEKVKEYNDVYAKRDPNEKFLGYAFYTTTKGDSDQVFAINDRPISGLIIKDDGKLYCEIATNYSYNASKKYDVEAVNYIPSYGYYGECNAASLKFKWCANVKDILDMKHVAGENHNFKYVTVKPSCLSEGFDEKRCTECGISAAEEKTNLVEASEHHFLYNETEKTHICTKCNMVDQDASDHNFDDPEFQWKQVINKMECTAVFACKDCDHTEKVRCDVDLDSVEPASCTEDGVVNATAECNFQDNSYTDEKQNVPMKAWGHSDPIITFKWAKDKSMCYAHIGCERCDRNEIREAMITETTQEPTYIKEGKRIYTAEITFEGREYQDQQETAIPKLDPNARFEKSSYKINVFQKEKAVLVSDMEDDEFENIETQNSKIATVSKDGTITGKSAGKTELTAVTKSGETLKATITVNKPTVKLSASSAPLQLKKSTTAIKVVSKLSGDSVSKWTTSSKTIATVSSSGKITGKKTGKATITVTMKSGAKATCKITVQKNVVTTTKLSVDKTSITLQLKGTKTYNIKTVQTPVTSQQLVRYSSSNTKIATVSSSGKITAKKAGKATITVYSGKVKKKITVTVKTK
ncbi:MAG: Ig-like domain-containing protein [Lachnospiraceae bacterium]|nr:Ig-like domain-containing protein [Lachnospiraceae bacterium]